MALAGLVLQVAAARLLGAGGLAVFSLVYGALVLVTAVCSGMVGDSLTVLDRHDRGVRAGLHVWTALVSAAAGLAGALAALVTDVVPRVGGPAARPGVRGLRRRGHPAPAAHGHRPVRRAPGRGRAPAWSARWRPSGCAAWPVRSPSAPSSSRCSPGRSPAAVVAWALLPAGERPAGPWRRPGPACRRRLRRLARRRADDPARLADPAAGARRRGGRRGRLRPRRGRPRLHRADADAASPASGPSCCRTSSRCAPGRWPTACGSPTAPPWGWCGGIAAIGAGALVAAAGAGPGAHRRRLRRARRSASSAGPSTPSPARCCCLRLAGLRPRPAAPGPGAADAGGRLAGRRRRAGAPGARPGGVVAGGPRRSVRCSPPSPSASPCVLRLTDPGPRRPVRAGGAGVTAGAASRRSGCRCGCCCACCCSCSPRWAGGGARYFDGSLDPVVAAKGAAERRGAARRLQRTRRPHLRVGTGTLWALGLLLTASVLGALTHGPLVAGGVVAVRIDDPRPHRRPAAALLHGGAVLRRAGAVLRGDRRASRRSPGCRRCPAAGSPAVSRRSTRTSSALLSCLVVLYAGWRITIGGRRAPAPSRSPSWRSAIVWFTGSRTALLMLVPALLVMALHMRRRAGRARGRRAAGRRPAPTVAVFSTDAFGGFLERDGEGTSTVQSRFIAWDAADQVGRRPVAARVRRRPVGQDHPGHGAVLGRAAAGQQLGVAAGPGRAARLPRRRGCGRCGRCAGRSRRRAPHRALFLGLLVFLLGRSVLESGLFDATPDFLAFLAVSLLVEGGSRRRLAEELTGRRRRCRGAAPRRRVSSRRRPQWPAEGYRGNVLAWALLAEPLRDVSWASRCVHAAP